MTDHDEETLAEWLFFARKQRRHRTTHTTHSNQNTQEDKK